MIGSLVVYTGFLFAAVGLLSAIQPPRFLRIHTRRTGLVLAGAGLVLLLAGFGLPAVEHVAAERKTRLDAFIPAWQFAERHAVRVNAPADRVFAAIREVSADEIALFRTLAWIRRLGRSGPESILNPPKNQPILDVALRSGFLRLAEEPEHELVLGTAVLVPRELQARFELTPDVFARPPAGTALAAMNFLIEPDRAGGTLVSTETRVYASTVSARRVFSVYWRVILPGSALIRQMWLRAIKRRAELDRSG